MKGLRKSLAVIAAAAMLLALVPAVVLAGEDTLTGTFSVNDPPSVTSVTLTPTAMTPQTEYSVTVAVSDADDLSDLTTVVLKVYYDTDTTTNETEYDGKTADTQTCAIITLTVATDTFTVDPTGGGTTWVLGTGKAFTTGEKKATTGDCIFDFTPGKVATETTGSDNWQLAAKATDSASQTGWNYDTTPGATMAWYGEVAIDASAAIDFGLVNPGMVFADCTPQAVYDAGWTPIGVQYISNGDYDEKVKTDSTWGASSALAEDGVTDVAEEFALKADDDATLADAQVVDSTGVVIDTPNGQTVEAGDVVDSNNLWLQLADTFTAGSYSGNITYIIANA